MVLAPASARLPDVKRAGSQRPRALEHAHLFGHPELMMIEGQRRDQRPRTAAAACALQLREKDAGHGPAARCAQVPVNETGTNSDPRGEVHVVCVPISVYGHRARDSLGGADDKAHVQVS